MKKDFNPLKRLIEADFKIEPKRPTTGSADLNPEIMKMFEAAKGYIEIEKQLANANAKLAAIKEALHFIPYSWGAGPRAFMEKIRSIIEAS